MLTYYKAEIFESQHFSGEVEFNIEAIVDGKKVKHTKLFTFDMLSNKSFFDHLFDDSRKKILYEIEKNNIGTKPLER